MQGKKKQGEDYARSIEADLSVQLQFFFQELVDQGVPVNVDLLLSPAEQLKQLQSAVIAAIKHDAPLNIKAEHPRHHALIASEKRFRTLFVNMEEGFGLGEAKLDKFGRLIDFRWLEINDIFAELTGLPCSIIGKPVTPANSEPGSVWIQRYTLVALAGRPMHFTEYVARMDAHYDVYCYCPEPGRFAAHFREITGRHQLKTTLDEMSLEHAKKSEERLLLAQQIARIGSFEWDIRANINVWSPELEAIYGLEPGSFGTTHESWLACIHPADRAKAEFLVKDGLAARRDGFEGDWRALWPDGTVRWVASRARIYYDDAANPLKMVGINMDITERKQVEEVLRESDARFRELANAMPQLVWTAKPDGSVDYYNDRLSEYGQGFSRNDEGVFEWIRIVHPDDVAPSARTWEHAVKTGEIYEVEQRVMRADGTYHWHITRAAPVRNDSKQIVKWLGTSTDIHALKMTQESAQKNEERLRMAQQAARIGSFEYDFHIRANKWSPELEALYGMEPGSFNGTLEAWLARVHHADRANAGQITRKALAAHEENFTGEWRAVWPDGTVRWIAGRAKIQYDGAAHPVRMIGINMDITEQKEVEEDLRQSQERFRLAADVAPFPLQIHAEDGEVIMINRAWTAITGYTLEEIPTIQTWTEKALGKEAAWAQEKIGQLFEGSFHRNEAREYRIRCKDGSERIWQFNSSSLGRQADGRETVMSMAVDITERKRTEEELKLAATVYQDSSEAMMVTDDSNRIVAINQAFTEITGFEPVEVIGKKPSILKSDHHDAPFYKGMWEQIQASGRYKGEIWNRKKNGDVFAANLTINVVGGKDGGPFRYVALMSDITEKKRSDDLIWLEANFDSLTNLPNRRFFRDRLRHDVLNAKRSNQPMALMLLDLDGFKYVNDTLGHDMGDLLLKEAAERLRASVRESDTVARLGGDEFVIILTEVHDPGNVDRVARHILKVLSDPIKLGEELARVSASIGITLFPDDAVEAEDLIRNADQAMYAAKHEGKNQYRFFTQEMQELAMRRLRIINDMRSALQNNQFDVVYQPIVDLSSGAMQKAEALIRWQHPRKGLLNPIEFINAAEDTGMISTFGNWIFQEATKQAAIWREKYHPAFQISINISPVQIKSAGIDSAFWFEHLRELGLPGQSIAVEITEGLLLDGGSNVKEQLMMLRNGGIEVSLDDFGTGYSSLSYLQKFDIDYIKIDQAFISNLESNSSSMALYEAMLVMAHKLKIKVIAEGVETACQHEILANTGCDFAQGYYFSRPVPAGEFEHLLDSAPFSSQKSFKI